MLKSIYNCSYLKKLRLTNHMNHQTNKELEKHPLYPSGEWEGFFTYDGFAGKDKMDFYLEFSEGKIKGYGDDSVGRFKWDGIYNKQDGNCSLVKFYIGNHNVYYSGYVDENGIWGQWFIPPFTNGEFHIWPKKDAGNCLENEISEEEIDALEEKLFEIEVIT